MSQVLYALVILQGSSGLTFSPGYATAAECMQKYKGPNVACFNYDPEGTSWTAFFKLPDGAFRGDIPAACRQLAQPDICNVATCPGGKIQIEAIAESNSASCISGSGPAL